MEDTFQCRPCRKTYSVAEVQGRRACPLCRGPLRSQRQLEGYRADTQASLNRLKHQSALTLAGGAMVALVVQTLIHWYERSEDFQALTWLVYVGSSASLVAAGLWWKTGTRSMMLLASVLFQAAALVYAFSVFAASSPLFEVNHSRAVTWGVLAVALSPLGLSLLAWHQHRSYVTILKS